MSQVLFTGDPKIYIGKNGASMSFTGGQPVLDAGLENAVVISLFTESWAGNVIFPEDQRIGSGFQAATRKAITLTSLNDIENEAALAIEWMRAAGLVSNIEIDVSNPAGNIINIVIKIQPPGADIQELLIQKNGANWLAQINTPAYLG